MARKKPQDLSLRELRFLLVEKRRAWRHVRLQHFQRTQRVTPFLNEWNTVDVLDNGPSHGGKRAQSIRVPHRTWVSYLLLVLEVLAVIGIIAIVVSSLSTLGIINRSVSAALTQPTPMIQAVVLPDGHTPPNRPVQAWAGDSLDNKPYLAVDSQDRVYITDPERYRVIVFSSSGTPLATFGQYGTEEDAFALPVGIASDSKGMVWIVDTGITVWASLIFGSNTIMMCAWPSC